MNYGMVLAATAVMALVTYLPRMLPMAVIKRKIQNRFIRSFFNLRSLCGTECHDVSGDPLFHLRTTSRLGSPLRRQACW